MKTFKEIIAVLICVLFIFSFVSEASAQTIQDNISVSIKNEEPSQIPSIEPNDSQSVEPSINPNPQQSASPSPSTEQSIETSTPSTSLSVEPSESPDAAQSSDSFFQTMDASEFASGTGTQSDPYLISSPDQLNNVRNFPDASFLVTNDIDMTAATSSGGEFYNSGAGWAPVAQLNGSFDGGGHKIIGLKINRPQEDVGLFKNVKTGAGITNLGMEGSDISGGQQQNEFAGGICADNRGTIEYCYNTGHVSGIDYGSVGGITGNSGGIISSCYNTGTIETVENSGSGIGYAGGIAGYGGGKIFNCFNAGTILGREDTDTGGIAGSGADISNCYNVGSIGSSSGGCGSLVGSLLSTYKSSGLYYYNANNYLTGAGDTRGPLTRVSYGNAISNDQLQDQSTFEGYDFNTVWTMGDADYPYPELRGMKKISFHQNMTDFAGGNGLPCSPFEVANAKQLNNIRNYTWGCFRLTNDIDLGEATGAGGEFYYSGKGWDPIDNFMGEFNGNGHTIRNLIINRPDESNVGLFSSAPEGSSAFMHNLALTKVNIKGNDEAGSLVGSGGGSIQNIQTDGIITGNRDDCMSGGIIGLSFGSIEYCSNACSVSGFMAGGIAGSNNVSIKKCFNTGDIASNAEAGGIAALSYGDIIDCYNLGGYKPLLTYCNFGGIAGSSRGMTKNCYNAGPVASYLVDYAGIVNSVYGTQNMNCYYLNNAKNGAINGSSANFFSKSITEMKQQATYEGFDFNNTWDINEGSGFPVLRNMPFIYADGILLNNHSLGLVIGQSATLMENISPKEATNKNVIWESSDPQIVTVADRAVTAIKPGTATITVSTQEGGFLDTCQVTVYSQQPVIISFDTQGGSSIPSQTIPYNTFATTPTNPVRAGYTFGGWYWDSALRQQYLFNVVVIKDLTLYAKWIPNMNTVSFNSQGGSEVFGYPRNIPTGNTIMLPLEPSRYGYAFGGWYREPECVNSWNFVSDTVVCSTTLYAKWVPNNYTVIFNSQGGSLIPNAQVNYMGTILKPVDPTRPGYTFEAWYKEFGYVNAWNFSTDMATGITNLFAKWVPNQYTVTFNCEGGSTIDSKTASFNDTITAPATPILTGYTFGGWYKESGCINAWNFSTDTIKGLTTLYAKWTVNQYTVTFNSQGGSGVPGTVLRFGSTIPVPGPPVKTGYAFAGWYRDTLYTAPWNFTSDTVEGNTTLYAKWNADTQTPTLDSISLSANPCITPVFTVVAKGVSDPSSVKSVQFAVWSETGGQDDLQWYNGTSDGMGNWVCNVNALNHKNDVGIYNIHVYGTDSAGNFGFLGSTTIDMDQREHTPPALGSIALSANPCKTTTCKVTAKGVSDPAGVKSVQFAVWSDNNGQDDLRWYNGTSDGKGNWSVTINAANHRNDTGIYQIHAYGTDKLGNFGFMGMTSVDMEQRDHRPPVMGSILLSANPCTTPTFKVTARGVADDRSGVRTVQFAVWSENNGQDDLRWYTAKSDGRGNWTATVKVSEHKNDSGIYTIHVYGTDKTGNQGFMGMTTIYIIN